MSTDSGLRHIDHLTYINTWASRRAVLLIITILYLIESGRERVCHEKKEEERSERKVSGLRKACKHASQMTF